MVVIDNNSTDKSVSYIKSNYKSVELISNPKNYGFSKGYNSNIKINFDFLLLINDVEVTRLYQTSLQIFVKIKNLQLFNLKYLMVIIKINLNTLGQLVVILIILVSLFAKEELEI